MSQLDLRLKNARLIDPAQGIDRVMDLGFEGGNLVEPGTRAAKETRDLTGLIVTPGLIDMHTHVYWGGTSLGVDADAYARASAVGTLVDTGSAGPGNFAGFRSHVIEQVQSRILAYLHISHAGIFGFSDRVMVGESEDIRLMDPLTCLEVARANPDLIVGIKVRLGTWTSGKWGIAPLDYALQVAEEAGLPMMVHIDDPPPSYAEVVARLRGGDVLTHCFRPFPNAPVQAGKILPEVQAARDRSVFFDIGHGMGSFCFDVARQALKAGFAPDTISSDVHQLCINGPAFDLLTTMSKFMALGMSLTDVIRCNTEIAANVLQRPTLGSVIWGNPITLSVLALEDGAFTFTDTMGKTITAKERLVAKGLVRGGVWVD